MLGTRSFWLVGPGEAMVPSVLTRRCVAVCGACERVDEKERGRGGEYVLMNRRYRDEKELLTASNPLTWAAFNLPIRIAPHRRQRERSTGTPRTLLPCPPKPWLQNSIARPTLFSPSASFRRGSSLRVRTRFRSEVTSICCTLVLPFHRNIRWSKPLELKPARRIKLIGQEASVSVLAHVEWLQIVSATSCLDWLSRFEDSRR